MLQKMGSGAIARASSIPEVILLFNGFGCIRPLDHLKLTRHEGGSAGTLACHDWWSLGFPLSVLYLHSPARKCFGGNLCPRDGRKSECGHCGPYDLARRLRHRCPQYRCVVLSGRQRRRYRPAVGVSNLHPRALKSCCQQSGTAIFFSKGY
jgi:hypothetical protein